jgi:Ion channel
MRIRPRIVFVMYLAVIIVCAALYYFIPSMLSAKNIDVITSIYFSVITITTVGYGDIGPVSYLGKIITASEAFVGIIIIGLFLNALWQSYAQKIADDREQILLKQQREKSIDRIKIYYSFLDTVMASFKLSVAELTTPIERRRELKFAVNEDFKFSDLKDIFKFSIILTRGFNKSVLQNYVDSESEMKNELKYFLANFDIYDYPKLHESIVSFLTTSKSSDGYDGLISILTSVGNHAIINHTEKVIQENETCPDINQHQSTLLVPVILLNQSVKEQIKLINIIEQEFKSF